VCALDLAGATKNLVLYQPKGDYKGVISSTKLKKTRELVLLLALFSTFSHYGKKKFNQWKMRAATLAN